MPVKRLFGTLIFMICSPSVRKKVSFFHAFGLHSHGEEGCIHVWGVYVCVHVCACVYQCMYVDLCVHTYVCTICTCVCTCMRLYVCMYVHAHRPTIVCMYVCVCVYICTGADPEGVVGGGAAYATKGLRGHRTHF